MQNGRQKESFWLVNYSEHARAAPCERERTRLLRIIKVDKNYFLSPLWILGDVFEFTNCEVQVD